MEINSIQWRLTPLNGDQLHYMEIINDFMSHLFAMSMFARECRFTCFFFNALFWTMLWWLGRSWTFSQAFSTEVEELGDSEASDLLISGSLIRVKGWWRKGARDWDWDLFVTKRLESGGSGLAAMLIGWFGARWFGILLVHPSNNPFHMGIPGIQTTNPNQQINH